MFACISIPALSEEKLTLEDSIKIALENNPSVRIAKENLRKAEAMIAEAVSRGMPKLTIDATYQRLDEVPKAAFGDQPVELGTLESRTADLTLVQPIDIFGLVRANKEAAKVGKTGYEYALLAQMNNISLDVKTAFYQVLRAQKQLKVQEDTIALLEANLKDTKAKYEAGTIAKFDVLRAETQLANARQALISAQNNVELAKAAFNNILGRPLDTPVNLVEPEMPGFITLDMASCVQTASEFRPEVLQAKSGIEFSEKMVEVANLSGKPTVAFRWVYNRNFDTTIFNPRDSSWRAFLAANINVFDGGQTKAKVDQATADANNARLGYQQAKDMATLDARQSYLSLKESEERIRAAEKALEQAREGMRLAQVRYRGGVSTQLEVLDAQTALTQAETNYVNALYDYQIALAKLERAVGGKEQLEKLIKSSPQSVQPGN
jgi:TolC family type I secretion outer membrane protein